MPSRPVTLGIVVFWLAVTGWMVSRHLRQAEEPPPLALDPIDEAGAHTVNWEVRCDGRPAGSAETKVVRAPQGGLELRCKYAPSDFHVRGLTVRHLASAYRVTPWKGRVRALSADATLILFLGLERETQIRGRSEDGWFTPLLRRDGREHRQEAVEVAADGQVLNVLHPLNKMAGLYAGRTWHIALLDPLAVAAAGPAATALPKRVAEARVGAAALAWYGAEVPCWRVEYREAGAEPAVVLWARQGDGVVLQQEVQHHGTKIVLKRKPNL
jgi:hypothetical protein